jgi:hypothetical protein
LETRLGEAARRRAMEAGISFSALVARALRRELTERGTSAEPPPFRLVTVGGEGPYPGIDLDRTSELLAAEDSERYGDGE